MNYSRKTIITFILAIFVMATSAFAQKFGHINSQQLLFESPLVKAADAEISTYQEGLISKGKAMVAKLEADYNKYVAEADAGGLSKVQMAQREAELGKSQQAIQKYEVEVQQKIAVKKEELYKPILEEAKKAIDEIGAAENYTMIFDTGGNGLLFAVESEDLLDKVKAKLGW